MPADTVFGDHRLSVKFAMFSLSDASDEKLVKVMKWDINSQVTNRELVTRRLLIAAARLLQEVPYNAAFQSYMTLAGELNVDPTHLSHDEVQSLIDNAVTDAKFRDVTMELETIDRQLSECIELVNRELKKQEKQEKREGKRAGMLRAKAAANKLAGLRAQAEKAKALVQEELERFGL